MSFNKRGYKLDFIREHIYYFATVVNINDPWNSGRIKCRISGEDDEYVGDSDLPWTYALTPKFFNVVPQVGEGVRVLMHTTDVNKSNINRTYVGPILGQPQNLIYQDKRSSLGTQSDVGPSQPLQTIGGVSETGLGIYPNPTHVSIEGRDNSDIVLRPERIDLRAGKFISGRPTELNRDKPSRIQLNHFTLPPPFFDEYTSTANIISENINLISYTGQPGVSFDRLSQQGLDSMSGSKLQEYLGGNGDVDGEGVPIGGVLHPLVYGDVLIDFIRLMKKFVSTHTHPYHNHSPDVATSKSDGIQDIMKFNLSKLISHRIRIN